MVYQRSCGITAEEQNLLSLIHSFGNGTNLVGIQTIVEGMKVLQVSLQGGTNKRSGAAAFVLRSLHRIQRRRVSNRKIVQMPLKVLVRRESQTLDNSDGRSRIGAKPVGKRTDAQEHIRSRTLKDRTNDLLPFRTQLPKLFCQTVLRNGQPLRRSRRSHY